MTLYVFDAGRVRMGVVVGIKSLQWLPEYQDVGSVKLVCDITPRNKALLGRGHLLYNTDDNRVCIVKDLQIDDDIASASITIWGELSLCRLAERSVIGAVNLTNAEAGMRTLLQSNLRGLPLALAAAQGYTERVDGIAVADVSVLEGCLATAKQSGLGLTVTFDPERATETFSVYKGINRMQGQPGYNGYFGADIGNLRSVSIQCSTKNSKNVAFVIGEGEGAARKVVTVGDAQGANRREMIVKATSSKRKYQIDNGNGTYTEAIYTEAQYTAVLQAKGVEELLKKTDKIDIKAEVEEKSMLLGRDYSIGDILPLKLTQYGLLCSARVAGARLVYEADKGRRVFAMLEDITILEGSL